MRYLLLLYLLASSVLSLFAQSQPRLVLDRGKGKKPLTYQLGEFIVLDQGNKQQKSMGTLLAIDVDRLVLGQSWTPQGAGTEDAHSFQESVPIDHIEGIYNTHNQYWTEFRRSYSAATMGAGGAMVSGMTLNILLNDASPSLSQLLMVTSIMATGLAIRYLGKDRYRVGKRNRLWVMEGDPAIGTQAESGQTP